MPPRIWPTTVGALVASAALLAALLAALPAGAENSCRSQCWEAYGICYRSTSKRERCQGLLYRCLSKCLRTKKR